MTDSLPLIEEAHAQVTELSPGEIQQRTEAAKRALGRQLLVLGHHYQRDAVIRFADRTGDSFALARHAAECREARWVVFCGVHFMAETADMLTPPEVMVLLPDRSAGCSMADMADIDQVEACWEEYHEVRDERLVPVTYMNSSAAIKAFTGRHGGAVCTSSNALGILRWAFTQGKKVLFIPDEHLGRNTAFFQMGLRHEEMLLWDPQQERGGHDAAAIRRARMLLWKGHCSVHMNFQPDHVDRARAQDRDVKILVHPECNFGVVEKADLVGSTEFIIKSVEAAPAGSSWAIGTEHNLVGRLAAQHPEQHIRTLSPFACQCSTMYRIDPVDLMRTLEGIPQGTLRWPVQVEPHVATEARHALERMLAIPR